MLGRTKLLLFLFHRLVRQQILIDKFRRLYLNVLFFDYRLLLDGFARLIVYNFASKISNNDLNLFLTLLDHLMDVCLHLLCILLQMKGVVAAFEVVDSEDVEVVGHEFSG